jgi:hypothetical protein
MPSWKYQIVETIPDKLAASHTYLDQPVEPSFACQYWQKHYQDGNTNRNLLSVEQVATNQLEMVNTDEESPKENRRCIGESVYLWNSKTSSSKV